MKLLMLHSDYLNFESNEKALDSADENAEDKKIGECLVAFHALQKEDEDGLDSVVSQGVDEIKEVAEKVGVDKVVVYPYVHLVSDPARPEEAKEACNDLVGGLQSENLSVVKAPFGWYKQFEIKVKGHPLSELSREIKPKKENRDEVVEEIDSDYYILRPNGEEISFDPEDESELEKIDSESLKSFVMSEEMKGSRRMSLRRLMR